MHGRWTILASLIMGCTAAAPTQPATTQSQSIHRVLVIRAGRLATMEVDAKPATCHRCWWEGGASRHEWDGSPDSIFLHLDHLGARSPFFIDVRFKQAPDGTCELVVQVTSGGKVAHRWVATAPNYVQAARIEIGMGSTLGECLARLSDGYPPLDTKVLAARLSTKMDTPTIEIRLIVGRLNNADWRIRDAATAELRDRPDWFPQLRSMLMEGMPVETRMRIDAVLAVPGVGDRIKGAVKP